MMKENTDLKKRMQNLENQNSSLILASARGQDENIQNLIKQPVVMPDL